MANYVAIHMPNPLEGIYGVAECPAVEDTVRLIEFCDAHGLEVTTGSLHTVDQLMENTRITFSTRFSRET